MKGLSEKRIVITGGASGIGKAAAFRFIEEESHVIIIDRDDNACAAVKEEIPGLTSIIRADVGNYGAVKNAFLKIDKGYAIY